MRFHEADYLQYIVVGKHGDRPLYQWEIWKELYPQLDDFVRWARGKRTGIRSVQINSSTKDYVSFGRMSWNEKGHMKWSHGSPLTEGQCEHWIFEDVEIWAPHWNQCEDEDKAPDLYFSIGDRFDHDGRTSVMLALRSERVDPELESAARSLIGAICAEMIPEFTAKRVSWWGEPDGSAFTYAINDFQSTALRWPGAGTLISLDALRGDWEAVTVG